MLDALYAEHPLQKVWCLAVWAYTSPTPLWLKGSDGQIRECIPSANGVRQGCGLGALLFALSTKEVFEKTVGDVSSVHGVAIMDDFYILGKAADILKAYKRFATLCSEDGSLALNKKKGTLIDFHSEDPANSEMEEAAALGLKMEQIVAKVEEDQWEKI